MKLFERLADWCKARGRQRVIMDHLLPTVPYLTRNYLLGHDKSRWFAVFLHQIHRSDEAVLHDHPWLWISIILSGGYFEWNVRGERIWRRRWSIRFRYPTSLHRIEMAPDSGPVWTLFISFARVRSWGFWVPIDEWLAAPFQGPFQIAYRAQRIGVWVPYQDYLDHHAKAANGALP